MNRDGTDAGGWGIPDLTEQEADDFMDAISEARTSAEIAAAEQRGREDNARHDMCYVYGSKALQARLAEAWDEGFDKGVAAGQMTAAPAQFTTNPYRATASEGNDHD